MRYDFYLLQQLQLASYFEPDINHTVDWCKKLNSRWKLILLLDQLNNSGGTDEKMNESILHKKSSFKMIRMVSSSNLDWAAYIVSIVTIAFDSFSMMMVTSCRYVRYGYLASMLIPHRHNTISKERNFSAKNEWRLNFFKLSLYSF